MISLESRSVVGVVAPSLADPPPELQAAATTAVVSTKARSLIQGEVRVCFEGDFGVNIVGVLS